MIRLLTLCRSVEVLQSQFLTVNFTRSFSFLDDFEFILYLFLISSSPSMYVFFRFYRQGSF